jgi:hypothetical protein
MTILEALQQEVDIRVSFMGKHLAWENGKWTVWINTKDGPLTFITTDKESIAVGVLMGHMQAVGIATALTERSDTQL